MKTILFFSCYFLIIACSQNQLAENSKKGKPIKPSFENIEDLDSNKYSLNELPKSDLVPPECLKEAPQDYFQSFLPKDLSNSGFKYYDYFLDTIVNSTQLAFAFRCLGGKNKNVIEERFLQEIMSIFGEMAVCETGGCSYFIISDSIKINNGLVNYVRHREYGLGGQSLGGIEKFVVKKNVLLNIVNSNGNNHIGTSDLMKYRTSEKYF